MTTKERWTVYPLLLLAIGLALRGELVGRPSGAVVQETVSAEAVVCRELVIVGETSEPGKTPPVILHAGRVKGGGGGRIEIRDAGGIDAMAIGTSVESRDGGIEFFDAAARLLDKLGPEPVASPEPTATDAK